MSFVLFAMSFVSLLLRSASVHPLVDESERLLYN